MSSVPLVIIILVVIMFCRRDDGSFDVERIFRVFVAALGIFLLSPIIGAWL